MKYKLKKDLPFAKAGTEIGIEKDQTSTKDAILIRAGGEIYAIPRDDMGLWIEKVEPREWDLYIDKVTGRPCNCTMCLLMPRDPDSEKIRVREVIE